MADEAGLSRNEVLARVRARVLAAARARLSPADAEDLTHEAVRLLSTKYAHVGAAEELVTQGVRIVAERTARWRKAARRLAAAAPDDGPDPVAVARARQQLAMGEAQRHDLLRAALDDQALFDALVEGHPLTACDRMRAWFERPATLADLAAVAAVGVAALAGFALLSRPAASTARTPAAARPIGTSLSPQHVAWLLDLPEQQVVPAGIEITGRPDAMFAPGEPLHFRISLRAPARIALLEEPMGGRGTQAWPGLGQPPALMPQPSSGGPAIQQVSLETPLREGMHRLRLVVAPADLDLGALSPAALPGLAGRLTLVDLRYWVTRPRTRPPDQLPEPGDHLLRNDL